MCAINPTHKKRIIFDVYTSSQTMTKEDFEGGIMDTVLSIELDLTSKASELRWHVKESTQEAD